ncbi:hypothetical protein DXG01_005308, partial [Tephrocybe rancida]
TKDLKDKPAILLMSHDEKKLAHLENMYSTKEGDNHHPTEIQEVWFAGCHTDVGGGSVDNKITHSLARIPLRWMVHECFKTNTGMMFNTEALRTIGLDPVTLYPYVLPWPPPRLDALSEFFSKAKKASWFASITVRRNKKKHTAPSRVVTVNDHSVIDEEMEDLKDALSPVYDQLKLKRGWWILEIMPLNLRYQNGNNEWVTNFRSNLANLRFIPKQHSNGVCVHRSVKKRMDAQPPPGHKC